MTATLDAIFFFFFSSRRRHTRFDCEWSSDVCSSDLVSRRHHWPGPMPAAGERYTYELHRDDVLALLERLPGPAHLVGHSYGAGVVLLAALQAPERVRSLTLIEPAFGMLLPEAGAGLAEEKSPRVAALGQVRALVDAEKHLEAAEVLIDWVQGGRGGVAQLPE